MPDPWDAFSGLYRCADGHYVALSGSTQAMAKRLVETIGRAPDGGWHSPASTFDPRVWHMAALSMGSTGLDDLVAELPLLPSTNCSWG